MAKTLNLEEVFGQRERPTVRTRTGKVYELALPDEMDPRDELQMLKLARRTDSLINALPEDMEESGDRYEEAVEVVNKLLSGQIRLLNEELAEEKLGYAEMNAILTFYKAETAPKDVEEPETET